MAEPSVIDTDGRAIAAASIPQKPIECGPWLGSMRSRPPDRVPKEYATAGLNFLYMPRYGYWRRRGGQTQRFDSFGSPAGMLPAKWSAKARWSDEFLSESISDGIPTVATLLTRESVAAGLLDDGRFSNFWVRDQVNSLNYTVGDEFNTTTYPDPGTVQTHRFSPLWYDSGDGGITRGTTEFLRRFFFSGSRRFLKVGNWTYHPSALGTPSRWRNRFTPASQTSPAFADIQPSSDVSGFGSGAGLWGLGGTAATGTDGVTVDDGDTKFIYVNNYAQNLGNVIGVFNMPAIPDALNAIIVTYRAKLTVGYAGPSTIKFEIGTAAGNRYDGGTRLISFHTAGSYGTYTYQINFTTPLGSGTANRLTLRFENIEPAGFAPGFYITYLKVGAAITTAIEGNRLIPSGPIPPVHAGLLVKGNMIAGSAGTTFARPNADIGSPGGWTEVSPGTSLWEAIDEVTPDDTDYIVDAGAAGAAATVSVNDPGFVPTSSTHTVRVSLRASGDIPGATPTLQVDLMDDVTGTPTSRASRTFTAAELTNGGSTAARWVSFDLTAAQITSVTQWADLGLKFTAGGVGGPRVYYAALEITAAGSALLGGWRGKDRFFHSVAYRFEDDSVWMPCMPRFPNTRLPNGYNLFTIDSANTGTAFDKVTWSNLPVPPFGVKSIILLRTPKIDSTAADNLTLDPFDLRVVVELKAGTTSYDDYGADDDSLTIDPGRNGTDKNGFFIRFDHMMPPRARYIAGGDMRVIHSYGGTNPCAIELAPVGAAADYDRNAADDAAAVYAVKGMYFRIVIDSSGVGTIEFKQGSNTAIAFAFVDHPKLQDLVDRVNADSTTSPAGQWRMQLCPGVSPQADCLASLTPHSRAITSCVVAGQTITRAAGGLSKVAVGNLISGTGVTTGAYVSQIVSDTQLTFVGTITAGTKTLTFYTELGDTPTAGFENQGWQRVIANSLPGFIYFNKTYLATDTFDKAATWMTTASPGSNKSAPNNFSTKLANRFTPPLDAGASQGAAAVDQGFKLFYTNKRAVIRNTTTSEQGSNVDEEFVLVVVHHSSGCCAWNTIAGNGKFAIGLAPEGLIAGDLDKEVLLTEDIWQHGASEGSSGSARGDFSYEVPLCVAATARDIDVDVAATTITAYASARIMRSAIYLNYRQPSGSPVRPDRQIVYDFSSGADVSGLEALMRKPGMPWGWSVPLVRAFTAMTEGRRSDGSHLYGWNDANAGSTGDGRIDEFETGDTDNGTAIAASVDLPIFRVGANKMSVQEFTVEHLSPTGSTGSFTFHRSPATVGGTGDAYTFTPSTAGATVEYARDVKQLTLPARGATESFYWTYSQATGAARELRHVEFRVKSLPSYR